MDDNLNTGVEPQAEGETAASSPASEQTPQGVSSDDTSASPDGSEDKTAQQTVPYSRLKEINDKYKQTKEELAALQSRLDQFENPANQDPQADQVKHTLKQYGFMDKAEVESEIRKIKEDMALDRTLSDLESRYNGKDGRPKFDRQKVVEYAIERQIADPEVAYEAMNRQAIIDWHVKQASLKQSGVKSEKSDGSGGPVAGVSQQDLLERAAQGDQAALHDMLKRTSLFKKLTSK